MYALLLALAILLLSSCTGDPAADALHHTADSLIAVGRPDSALQLLNTLPPDLTGAESPCLPQSARSIQSPASLSRRQRMRHELLRARAMNKAYVDFTTDSVMKLVADYYDRHGTPNERMEAHYLLGCTYRDMGEAPQSLLCYQDAVDCADTTSSTCDYNALARIHGQMGDVFLSQSLYRNALSEYQYSNRYAWYAHDTLAAILFYGQIADCYYGLGDTDSTLMVFDETFKMLTKYGYSNHANTFLSIPIYILLSKGNYQKAKRYLDIYEHNSAVAEYCSVNINEYKKLFYYKGLYYAGTEQPDSAILCFKSLASQSSNEYDKTLAYSGLYSIYRRFDNRDSLDKYINLYKESLDSNLMIVESSRLQDIHSLYNYTRHQHIAAKASERAVKLKFWLLVCAMALVVLFLSTWIAVKYIKEADKKRLRLMTDKYVIGVLECQFLKSEQEDMKKQKDQLSDKYNNLCREMNDIRAENKLQDGTITQLRKEYEEVNNRLADITGKLETVNKEYEEAKQLMSQRSGKNMEEWDMEDAILSMPILIRLHQQAEHSKKVTDTFWEELYESVCPLMPNFMEKIDSYNLRRKSKGYKLCVLTRLHFSLSEICVLLGMSSQALNNMRRRMHIKLFGGEGVAYLFDENILQIQR